MSSTASRSGYDSTAEMAQAKTKKATGKLSDDEQKQQEGENQEVLASTSQDAILEPWARGQAAEDMKENGAE